MKNWITGGLATLRFELRRSFTLQRISVMAVLGLFPPVMVSLIFGGGRLAGRMVEDGEVIDALETMQQHTPFAIIFLTSLVCLLSLLLWATPNVHSEIEGRSWGFLSSRPGGRMAIYIGKFWSAVLISFMTSLVALSLSTLITNRMSLLDEPRRFWLSLTAIYLLACICYGAVFCMLGTIFFKRAMVIAAGYLIGSEVFLASVPAVINKFTLRFHLQELGVKWIGFFLPVNSEMEYRAIFGEPLATWLHLLALAIGSALCLLVGAVVITNRQYITSEEN
jgi:ABC-type transport system involved in multi-copper enzyme maturation permease subunit